MRKEALLAGVCGILSSCSGQDTTSLSDEAELREARAAAETMVWQEPMSLEPGMFTLTETETLEGSTLTITDHAGEVVDSLPEALGDDGTIVEKLTFRNGHGIASGTDGSACVPGTTARCGFPGAKFSPWQLYPFGLGWGAGMEDAFNGVGDALIYARSNGTGFSNRFDQNATTSPERWTLYVYQDPASYNAEWPAPDAGSTVRGLRRTTLDCNFYNSASGTSYCRHLGNMIILFADNIRASADACTNGSTRQDVFERVAVHELGHAMGLAHSTSTNTAMRSGAYCDKPASFNATEINYLTDYNGSGSAITILP